MKQILLISPHSSNRLNESRYVSPAMGVNRIAGVLNANGHYAEAFDPNLHDLSDSYMSVEDKLKEKDWDIIGFSCLEETLAKDLSNVWTTRDILPNAMLIAGGIEAQYNYQTILDKSPCDIVVIGEGEMPMLLICDEYDLELIPGIIIKNKARSLSQEEFEIFTSQIDWENINYETYWDYYLKKYGDNITDEILQQIYTIRIYSRNMCPHHCKSCTSTNQLPDAAGCNVVSYGIDADILTDLILRIRKAHPLVRTIYITDDDFCINKKTVMQFCQRVIDKGLDDLSYMCFARADDINDDILPIMKKAGFRRLNIGIESFSDNVLIEIGKKCTAEKNIEALVKLKEYNIETFMTLMLITPGTLLWDLEETIEKTIEFIQDPFYTCGLSLGIRPTKGSQFYEEYFDFETYVTKIENTGNKTIFIKENKMIYAIDSTVKEIQIEYKNREGIYMNKILREEKIKHATYSNIAHYQLKLLQVCIDVVRYRLGYPKRLWRIRL